MKFDGILIFSLSLLGLIFFQRVLQKEIQIILLLITRNPNLTIGIFSILLLPGVLIHELSHLFMAFILKVPVKKISLIPEVSKNGKIRLGFVQTLKTDVVRDALIGLAPLLSGLLLVALISSTHLGITQTIKEIYSGDNRPFLTMLKQIIQVPDFGLWFYLSFAISTTMIPSESDRQSWKMILIVIIGLFCLILIAGFGKWMAENLLPSLNQRLLSISFVMIGAILVHLLLLLPAWLIRKFLMVTKNVSVA